MEGKYGYGGSVLIDGGDSYGVSSVSFDRCEELVWAANQGGHLTSYVGAALQRYTSFHVCADEEVRSLITMDRGVVALTKTTLKHHIRRGLPKFTYRSRNMTDMQCLIALNDSRIIMGGHQSKLIDFDLDKLKEINQHSLDTPESSCAILRRHSYMLAAGDPRGTITLHDPSTLRTQHVIETHSASLSDFDIQDNMLVSCGFSMNGGVLSCDCFLLAYDLRMLRPLPHLAVCCEPLLLRFVPQVSGQVAAVSSHGRVQLVDTMHAVQSRLNLFQVDTQNSQCLSFDISSTGQSLVFGDQAGHVHIYSLEQNEEPIFNRFSRETEFADTPEELPSISITDENFLLSSIPLPPLAPGRKLLSDWPELTKRGYRQPKPIDPEILKTMKMQGPIGCAPNPRLTLRNQIPYVFDFPSSPTHSKHVENSSNVNVTDNESNTFVAIPKRYRKVEVRYSKLGTNDFDFEHYNRTGFPGLEANLPNSYCNSMLQVLYYTMPIKRTLLRHTCNKEFCLSCELGFLFKMLDTSSGPPCQASNFLRAFRTVPEASALGLILSNNPEARSKTNLASLIQSWNRFILHQMHYEILETRKKVLEKDIRNMTNHVNAMSIDPSAYNHIDPLWEEFSYDESEFPEIGKKSQRIVVKQEEGGGDDRDASVTTSQDDEGKYLWLSSSALANTSESYDSVDYDLLSSHACPDGLEDSNSIDDSHRVEETNGSEEVANEDDGSKKYNTEETDVSRMFGTKQLQTHKCLKCNREENKESIVLLCNLQYPAQVSSEPIPFSELLRASLCPRKTTPAWCENCQKFTPTSQTCSVRQLPHLLAINCGLTTATDRTFWQKQMDNMVAAALGHGSIHEKFSLNSITSMNAKPCRYGTHCARPGCKFKHPEDKPSSPSYHHSMKMNNASMPSARTLHQLYIQNPWLPHEINIRLGPSGDLKIERNDLNSTKSKGDISNLNSTNSSKVRVDQNGITNPEASNDCLDTRLTDLSKQYYLGAVVCHVDDVQKNIVSFIKMTSNSKNAGSSQSQWFLFNDFCVTPVSAAEVTWFNLEWKVPCVLFFYNKASVPNNVPSSQAGINTIWQNDINYVTSANKIFFDDDRVAASSSSVTFTPLASHEMPKRGELVGMDAEFVTLNQEEAELKSDGRLSTIRPSHLAVARITCIRGQGSLEGTPFIDDYISTQEQVVDYLTKFSGIKPGDLDANFSSKHLTTLKSTYQKLRFLVDTGVIFVGHGLQNDFRVINLVIPPDQVIDTVQLFHLPHHRMVSLKFLAWHLLGTKIQSDTHDSTEDARTALQLYKRYLELESKGAVASSLASLYETGKALHWKVPED